MAEVYRNTSAGGAQVHALLIGVGRYPILHAAPSPKPFASLASFKELTSPLLSVEALTHWLKNDLHIEGLPLGSLRILGSSPVELERCPYPPPTLENIERAVHEWYDDVDSHEDNMALFYFCGHGFRVGDVHAVMAEDFNPSKHSPFNKSFDPEAFASAMLKARARRQIFLVDSCSSEVPMSEEFEKVSPAPLIQAARHKNLGVVKQTYLRASEFGSNAYARHNEPTLFMQALLQAMSGAATLPSDTGGWVVKTNSLRTAVNWIISKRANGAVQEVDYGARMSADISFHELQGQPLVPVAVRCIPHDIAAVAALHVNGQHNQSPSRKPWLIDLVRGAHEFSAVDFQQPSATYGKQFESVHPPFNSVSIPCGGKI